MIHDNYDNEIIQIVVPQSGIYSITVISNWVNKIFLYTKYFDFRSPIERLYTNSSSKCNIVDLKITACLESNITYALVLFQFSSDSQTQSKYRTLISGPNKVNIYQISMSNVLSAVFLFIFSLDHQVSYSSQLTIDNQIYSRICGTGNYHYETIEISVQLSGSYMFYHDKNIRFLLYIYEHNFDPSHPMENLLAESQPLDYTSSDGAKADADDFEFLFPLLITFSSKLPIYLEVNRKYILLLTTLNQNMRGSFTIGIGGPNNVTFNKIIKKRSSCVIGDSCDPYQKTIGLTINDILRNQVQRNISFRKQSSLIQGAAGITMIMFFIGFINGLFSLITFQNKELRKVGCGIYLLASSITSLLTITLFTIKFWFIVLTQLYSTINSAALRVDCVFIGPALKLCLYLDSWLNACVAIERTVNVSKGVKFDKNRSTRMARRMIFILPILIFGTLIHEPIKHDVFKYTIPKYRSVNNNSTKNDSSFDLIQEHHAMCIIQYSHSLQNYNTFTLFFHLLLPFVTNLCSALFIIFGTARLRSGAKKNQTFKAHIIKQMKEHKQLLISPVILLILAVPRLILSLISGCVDPSSNPWLYLCGYFISYTPPMLIFAVFILPSELYTKTFKEEIAQWLQRKEQHNYLD